MLLIFNTFCSFLGTHAQDTIHLPVLPLLSLLSNLYVPKLRSWISVTGHWGVLQIHHTEGASLERENVEMNGPDMGSLELWLQWTGVQRPQPPSESNSVRCLQVRTIRWPWCCSVIPQRRTLMCCQIWSCNSKWTRHLQIRTKKLCLMTGFSTKSNSKQHIG